MEAINKNFIQTQHVKARKNIKYTIEMKISKSCLCTQLKTDVEKTLSYQFLRHPNRIVKKMGHTGIS